MAGLCWKFLALAGSICVWPAEPAPTGRYGHAMAFDGVDKLWVFGGAINLSSGASKVRTKFRTNELWYFDLGFSKWVFVEPSGDWPPPRDMHALVFDVNLGCDAPCNDGCCDLWVIGGATIGNVLLNDVWCRDPVTGFWTVDNAAQVFSPRAGHVAAIGAYLKHIWIHGGQLGKNLSGDLFLVGDPMHNTDFQGLAGTWYGTDFRGAAGNSTLPVERTHHVAAYGNDCVWLHGGISSMSQTLNDFWCLKVRENIGWIALPAGPRRAHHVAVYGSGSVWVHGGVEGDVVCDDLWQFDVSIRSWHQVSPASSNRPAAVRDHAAAFAKGRIWVHSGWFREVEDLATDLQRIAYVRSKFEYSRLHGKSHQSVNWEYVWAQSQSYALAWVDNRVWTGLWSFDIQSRVWTLESLYESPATVNWTHAKFGLITSAVSFCFILLVTLLYFEFTLFRFVQIGCGLVLRPVGWGRNRQGTFVWRLCLCLLAWSILVAGPGLFWLRWTLRSELTESLNASMFVGPAAYSIGLLTMTFLFVSLMFFRVWTSQDETGSLMDPRALALFLLDADIRLVRFEFLLELQQSKRVLPRRQEAEKLATASGLSALMSHAEIMDWARAMSRSPQAQRVIALSHTWETREHPDPCGFQLDETVSLLEPTWQQDSTAIVGVFIDWVSLFQFKRENQHQNRAFAQAMSGMHILYGHEWTHTICVAKLTPPDVKARQQSFEVNVYWEPENRLRPVVTANLTENTTPYERRGWCIAELQWSGLRSSNHFGQILGTALLESQALLRRAPLAPAMFRKQLAKSDVVFTHRSDFLPLATSQKEAFDAKAQQVKVLALDGLPDTEIDILADSLQSYQLEDLCLSNCITNVRGFFLRLSWVQSLRKVAFQRCGIADDEMQELVQALTARCQWTSLDLRSNSIGDAGAVTLASALSKAPRLWEVILRENLVGDLGAKSLVEAWSLLLQEEDHKDARARIKSQVHHMDLRDNLMTHVGVATALALNPEPTTLSVLPQQSVPVACPMPLHFAIQSESPPGEAAPLLNAVFRNVRAFSFLLLQTALRWEKRRTA